jgi:hypothetical protein
MSDDDQKYPFQVKLTPVTVNRGDDVIVQTVKVQLLLNAGGSLDGIPWKTSGDPTSGAKAELVFLQTKKTPPPSQTTNDGRIHIDPGQTLTLAAVIYGNIYVLPTQVTDRFPGGKKPLFEIKDNDPSGSDYPKCKGHTLKIPDLDKDGFRSDFYVQLDFDQAWGNNLATLYPASGYPISVDKIDPKDGDTFFGFSSCYPDGAKKGKRTPLDATAVLHLDWNMGDYHDPYQIAAELFVGDYQYASPNMDGLPRVDIFTRHPSVPYGKSATPVICYGVQKMHPVDNENWANLADAPKLGSATLRIRVHTSVRQMLNSLASADADSIFTTALSNIQSVLVDAGFPTAQVEVKEVQDSDMPDVFTLKNKRWVAKPSAGLVDAKGGIDPAGLDVSKCVSLPFWDIYVVAEQRSPDGSSVEAGVSELVTFSDMTKVIDKGNATKRVPFPISIMWGTNALFAQAFGECATTDDKTNFLTNIITHEIGHTFGLRHVLDCDTSTGTPKYTLFSDSTNVFGGAVSTDEHDINNKCGIKFYGPVHVPIVKQAFGLS